MTPNPQSVCKHCGDHIEKRNGVWFSYSRHCVNLSGHEPSEPTSLNAPADTDKIELEISCSYSNIGRQWVAEALRVGETEWFAAAKGTTRPEALRNLADVLEDK